MGKLRWTLPAVAALGGVAAADSAMPVSADYAAETSITHGSHRGVAEDYLVMPEGGELTGQMKFITADPLIGDAPLRFTDLTLFGISGRWSLHSKLEVSGCRRTCRRGWSRTKTR